MTNSPRYRLDHIHLLVADRERSADWYHEVLGFLVAERSEDPYGPLVVSGDGGKTGLALFTSRVSSDPSRVVAFRVDAAEFIGFGERLLEREIRGTNGARLAPEGAVDHGDVISFYITDPDGNALEIMTREVNQARTGLRRLSAESRLEL